MQPENSIEKFYSLPLEVLQPSVEDHTTREELEANNLTSAFEVAEKFEKGGQ